MNQHTPARILPSYRKLAKKLKEQIEYNERMKSDIRVLVSDDKTGVQMLTRERWKMIFRFEEDFEKTVWAGERKDIIVPNEIVGKERSEARMNFVPFPRFEANGPTVQVMPLWGDATKAKECHPMGERPTCDDYKYIGMTLSAASSEFQKDFKKWGKINAKLRVFDIEPGIFPNEALDSHFPHWAEILPSGKIRIL